jgi:hypothetical protein
MVPVDHCAQIVARTVAAVKAVADGLIHEPPRVQLVVLGPGISENALLGRENFDGHISHLGKSLALQRDILVWPPEELDYGTALPAAELRTIGDGGVVPDEIDVIQSKGAAAGGLHLTTRVRFSLVEGEREGKGDA